jgi:hypothetical protein
MYYAVLNGLNKGFFFLSPFSLLHAGLKAKKEDDNPQCVDQVVFGVFVYGHFFLAAEYAIAAICFSLRFLLAGFSRLARVSSWMFADTALFMAFLAVPLAFLSGILVILYYCPVI